MTELTMSSADHSTSVKPRLDGGFNPLTTIIFCGVLAAGMLFTAYSLYDDMSTAGSRITTWVPFLLLGVALVIALGFEFVNGFHDTANAVATAIYTHALPPNVAVVWSGLFNFLGVLVQAGPSPSGSSRYCRWNSFFKSDRRQASRWCLPCSLQRSFGIWVPGI